MIRYIKSFLLLIILTLTFSIGYAQQTTSFLSGKVRDENNQPLQGVSVEITYVPWNKTRAAQTNKKGIFSVPNLPPGGPYSIKFSCSGYEAQTREVLSLNLGNVNDLSLHMRLENKEAQNGHESGNLVVSNESKAIKNSEL
jgi:hypothetical protein